MQNITIYGQPSLNAISVCYKGTDPKYTGWSLYIEGSDKAEIGRDIVGFDADKNDLGMAYEAQISDSAWEFWVATDEARR